MRFFHPALLVALCMFGAAIALAAQQPQTSRATTALTNKDITTMISARLSQEIVIAKIKSSACRFDTSPDKLAEIKKAGVPDAVILAMVQAPVAPAEVPRDSQQPANLVAEAPKDQGDTVYVNCTGSRREVHSTAFYASTTLAEVPRGDALTFLGGEKGY